MDSFYQITITKGKINENGEKVDVETVLDNLTREVDAGLAAEGLNNLMAKING